MRKNLLLILFALSILGCNPINKKVDKATFAEDIKKISAKYSGQYANADFGRLATLVDSSSFAGADSTYGELLTSIKAERLKKDSDYKKALKNYNDQVEKLSKDIDVTITAIYGKDGDQYGIVKDLGFEYNLTNTSNVPILGFTGILYVTDQQGNEHGRFRFKHEGDIVNPGQTIDLGYSFEFKEPNPNEIAIRNLGLKSLRFKFLTDIIGFKDGTIAQAPIRPVKPDTTSASANFTE